MAPVINVRVVGVERLARRLSVEQIELAYRTGTLDALYHVKRVASRYPAVRRGPLPGFPKSLRQLRYVHWAVRQGLIPYNRTGKLGAGWKSMPTGMLSGKVYNIVEYSPLVQLEGGQAMYHVITGWQTDVSVARSEAQAVQRIYDKAIQAALGG